MSATTPRRVTVRSRRKLVLVRLVLTLWASLGANPLSSRADHLVVQRPVSLKDGPSAAAAPVARVEPGQMLPLSAPTQVNGFYEVEWPQGTRRWVYRSFVRREPGSAPADTVSESPAPTLKVRVIDVGQGDAIHICCPDGKHQMVIDSGHLRYPNAAASFRNAITELQAGDNRIEVIVSTHPHADHIGCTDWLLSNYRTDLYVDAGLKATTDVYGAVEQTIASRGVRRESLSMGKPDVDFCPLSAVSAVVLKPSGFGSLSDPNDHSVIIRLEYGEDSFLFVGDAEAEEEEQLLHDPATRSLLDCDFLKIGHHGSETSSTEEFLRAVTPLFAAVSCGAPDVNTNKRYKHPRESTIRRVLQHTKAKPGAARDLAVYNSAHARWTTVRIDRQLYATSLHGDLLFESNGHGIVCTPEH